MELAVAVVAGLFVVVWATTSLRRPDDHQIAALAEMYRIPLSPPVVDRLRHRVTLLRRWRLAGALCGVIGSVVVSTIGLVDLSINVMLFSVAVGYGVASITVELVDAVRPAAERPVAGVLRRTVRSTIGTPAMLPCAATVAIVSALVVVTAVRRPASIDDSDLALVATALVAIVALAVVSVAAIIRAPERGTTAADHVVRRASRVVATMTVLGATWMIVGVLGSVVVRPLWTDRSGDSATNAVLAVAAIWVSLSGPMGFLATVTTLPRNRPFTRRPSPLRPVG
ncbi:MAG: hypothetical protein AAGD33_22895 [Actinomycetota bacterium]